MIHFNKIGKASWDDDDDYVDGWFYNTSPLPPKWRRCTFSSLSLSLRFRMSLCMICNEYVFARVLRPCARIHPTKKRILQLLCHLLLLLHWCGYHDTRANCTAVMNTWYTHCTQYIQYSTAMKWSYKQASPAIVSWHQWCALFIFVRVVCETAWMHFR